MATTSKGLGKLFGFKIGGKKKQKEKSQDLPSDDSEDEGYQDPTEVHATEPPVRTPVPDYPPPRPSGSPVVSPSPKIGSGRPRSSIELRNNFNSNLKKDNGHSRTLDASFKQIPEQNSSVPPEPIRRDDYLDPWDAQAKQLQARGAGNTDNYLDPYDSQIVSDAANSENYLDPWDTKNKSPEVPIPSREDYLDPWDTKSPASFPKSYEDEEDYSTPYDAGKEGVPDNAVRQRQASDSSDDYSPVYEEQRQQQQKNSHAALKKVSDGIRNMPPAPCAPPHQQAPCAPPHQPAQSADNYDDPWEYKQQQEQQRKPSATPRRPAPAKPANNQPVPQPRPHTQINFTQSNNTDTYDAPWEWKPGSGNPMPPSKPNVKATLSEPPVSKRASMPASNPLNPVPKPPRKPSIIVEGETPDGKVYEVDPSIPLANQGWYHGAVTRTEAEQLIQCYPDCSYLIRNSESSKLDYSLSLRNRSETMHLKISCRDGKFILGMNSRPYPSIPEMVHHYSLNQLNIRGAEQVKLLYPVLQEALYYTVEPGT